MWFTGLLVPVNQPSRAPEEALDKLRRQYVSAGWRQRSPRIMSSDSGFSDADRKENIRRVGEVANLMVEAGLVVLTAFDPATPRRTPDGSRTRRRRALYRVFVDTPPAICEARDPKGLYNKARAGELRNFTGIYSVLRSA
ncbi:adenylyl-sulfate kinase [Shigella sonnei]